MRGPIRVWVHEFDDATVRRLASAIERAATVQQDVLPIFIASYGGAIYSLVAMQDLIESAKKQNVAVSTIAIGRAMSAGADLLASGTRGIRFVAPGTTVMVHEGTDWIPPSKTREVVSTAIEAQRLDQLAFDRLDTNCGKPKGWWMRHLGKNRDVDLYLTPERAVELGVADHVGLPIVVHQRPQTGLMVETDDDKKKRPAKKRKRTA